MRWLLAVIAVAVASLAPASAFAWNDTGHMTIALIAYRQLDDVTRQKVDAVLKQHPHYELFLTKYVPDGVTPAEWAFIRAATWPDFVRPSRPGTAGETFKGSEITRFHRGPWHYIDMPWVPYADRKTIDPSTRPAPPPATPATQPANVLEALDENAKLLAAAQTPPQDKAVALAWVEHLIGDVHQPLHACTVYSNQYPDGDKGGNAEAVRAGGGLVVNLHAFWDESLGTSDTYDAINFLADEITHDPQLRPEQLAELANDRAFKSWADESHAYAVAFAYLNGRLRTTPYAEYESKETSAQQVMALPVGYEGNARALAKRRVAAAGYRLAEQVRSALKD